MLLKKPNLWQSIEFIITEKLYRKILKTKIEKSYNFHCLCGKHVALKIHHVANPWSKTQSRVLSTLKLSTLTLESKLSGLRDSRFYVTQVFLKYMEFKASSTLRLTLSFKKGIRVLSKVQTLKVILKYYSTDWSFTLKGQTSRSFWKLPEIQLKNRSIIRLFSHDTKIVFV